MPILCLEGPSAVGKTTTAQLLARRHGFVHVPEVQFLFHRPQHHRPSWYLERQVERYRMALEHSLEGALVVLDGDPFQPVWYNRLFPDASGTYADILGFYRDQLEQKTLAWPHRYIFLTASADELQKRKAGDSSRSRRNFDKHLALVGWLERYAQQLEQLAPRLAVRHVAASLEGNVRAALEAVRDLEPTPEPLEVFDAITGWLEVANLE